MKLADLGHIMIDAIPRKDNHDILDVSVVCEHKQKALTAVTNKDETVDQFAKRIGSLLRALANEPPRAVEQKKVEVEAVAAPTFEEQKAAQKAVRK